MGPDSNPDRQRLERLLPPILDTREAARALHVHPATVRRWRQQGLLRGLTSHGRRHLYPRDEVIDLLTGRTSHG